MTQQELDLVKSLSQEEILGLTIVGEGRGEPIESQVAIGCVIRNRMHNSPSRYANLSDVILEPKQFSCWNDNDVNKAYLFELAQQLINGQKIDDPYIRQCFLVAKGIVNWDIIDNTRGAMYYLTHDLFINNPPSWAKRPKNSVYLGEQVYFKV